MHTVAVEGADGEDIPIVDTLDPIAEGVGGQRKEKAQPKKPTQGQQCFSILRRLMGTHAIPHKDAFGGKAVPNVTWRDACVNEGVCAPVAFGQLKLRLKQAGKIASSGDFVWIAPDPMEDG